MQTQDSKKRIVFQVHKNTYNKLVKYAMKRGVTTSSLLRTWIQSTTLVRLETPSISTSISTTFNFWCDVNTLSAIDSLSRRYGISRSLLLRLIITNNLYSEPNKYVLRKNYTGINLMQLWKNGTYPMFSSYFDGDLERLSREQLYDYANINSDLSNYAKALESLWTLNNYKVNTSSFSKQTNSLYSNIHFNMRNIAKIDSSAGPVQEPLNQESALHLITLGSFQALTSSNNNFVTNFELANKYYVSNDFPLDIIKTCVLLSFGYSRQIQIKEIHNCFKIADEQLAKTANLNYLGWINTAKARFHYSQSNFGRALDFVIAGINNHKEYHMAKGLSEAHGIKAAIYISQNKYQQAYTEISKSQKFEREFRNDESDGLTNFLKLFIESKYNFAESISKLTLLKSNTSFLKYDTKNYVYASALYLHGLTHEDITQGLIELRKLSKTTNTFMQRAIMNTISSKTLSPFIV